MARNAPLSKQEILQKAQREREGGKVVLEAPTKIRRPTASDYLELGVNFKAKDVPSYEEELEVWRTTWQEQLSEPEKYGTAEYKAPIDFKQYVREVHDVLVVQVEQVIPQQCESGVLPKEDAAAATELGNILLRYAERFLRG